MNSHHSFFTALTLIFLSQNISAQTRFAKQEPVKVTFYYNAVWELTTGTNSFYKREAYFDLKDMVFDGVYTDFDKENRIIADGIYDHGIKSGIHTTYIDQKVNSKVEYSGNDFTIWEWTDGKSDGVKNGNGKFSINYFYFVSIDGLITPKQGTLSGEFRNGRKVGQWNYADPNHSPTDKEIYSNGKLAKHIQYSKGDSVQIAEPKHIFLSLNSINTENLAYDKSAFTHVNQYFEQFVTYPSSFNRSITYPGGLKVLLKLLAQVTMAPERNLGLIRIKIDEHGLVLKEQVARSINYTYDELMIKIFDRVKDRLFPPIQNGRAYATVEFIPIASGEEWERALAEMPQEWFLDPSNFD